MQRLGLCTYKRIKMHTILGAKFKKNASDCKVY